MSAQQNQRQQRSDIFSGIAWYYGDNDFCEAACTNFLNSWRDKRREVAQSAIRRHREIVCRTNHAIVA